MVVFLLAGCATSGPAITVNASPEVDLTSYQTWNFLQPLGTDRSAGFRSPLSSMLMSAMENQMAARGLRQSDTPDLLVDFFITTQERVDVRTRPTNSVRRSHWNQGWYNTWPNYETTVRQFTEGTLLIDLIDPNRQALVAEGWAQSRIRSTEFTQQQADEVVGLIMAQMLPH
jgi:hypothetical protein